MLVRILGPLPQSFGHPAQAVPALGCPHCYTGLSCQPRVPTRCLLAHRMQGLNVLRSRRQGQKRLKLLFCKLWNELVKLIQWLFNFFKSRALKKQKPKNINKNPPASIPNRISACTYSRRSRASSVGGRGPSAGSAQPLPVIASPPL